MITRVSKLIIIVLCLLFTSKAYAAPGDAVADAVLGQSSFNTFTPGASASGRISLTRRLLSVSLPQLSETKTLVHERGQCAQI